MSHTILFHVRYLLSLIFALLVVPAIFATDPLRPHIVNSGR